VWGATLRTSTDVRLRAASSRVPSWRSGLTRLGAATTVNRKLSAVGAFYTYAARGGVDVGELLTSWQVGGGRGGWKPFLHHISKSTPRSRRVIALKAPKKLPWVLTPVEVQAVLDGCERLRDRLLFAVLYDTGMRVGEALGLRHNDIAAARREVTVRRRDNANGARAKSTVSRTIPVSGELIRLYADYLHAEYGDLDSDYMFVNLWAHPHGHPLTYAAVYDLVRRLRRRPGSTSTRTGCDTRPRPGCCATESASRSSRMCSDTRMWPRPRRMNTAPWRTARRAMEQVGWFTGGQVQL
jgi:integrase/recombinase XerD